MVRWLHQSMTEDRGGAPGDEAGRGRRRRPIGRWGYGCLAGGLTVMAMLGAASMYPLSASTRSAPQPAARSEGSGPAAGAGSVATGTKTEPVAATRPAAGVASPRSSASAQSGECSRSLVVEVLEPGSRHIKAAHLDRSPEGQAEDLQNTDDYVKLHTVLVETMVNPIIEGVYTISDGTPPPLTNHIRVAHLERSPEGQAEDLQNTDQYAQTHTALVQNVAEPTIVVINGSSSGCGPEQQQQSPPAHGSQPAHGSGLTTAQMGQAMGVGVKDQAYTPANITINAGDSVTWTNNEAAGSGISHTVSSSGRGPLKSGNMAPGATYSYTFAAAGTYNYVCDVHPNMKGVVTVK